MDQLVQERATGQVKRSHPTPAMQWGIDHEDDARNWYARSRRVPVREIGFVVHPGFDYVGVSPDGLIASDGLIEIKCPQLPAFERVTLSGCVPRQYRWQIQGQLWVCQRAWTDFVCFYPPGRGRIIRVYAEYADFNALAERCTEIHAEVERRLHSHASGVRANPAAARHADTQEVERRLRPQANRVRSRSVAAHDASPQSKSEPSYARWWIAAAIIVVILYVFTH